MAECPKDVADISEDDECSSTQSGQGNGEDELTTSMMSKPDMGPPRATGRPRGAVSPAHAQLPEPEAPSLVRIASPRNRLSTVRATADRSSQSKIIALLLPGVEK
jgi:hypothetical protein